VLPRPLAGLKRWTLQREKRMQGIGRKTGKEKREMNYILGRHYMGLPNKIQRAFWACGWVMLQNVLLPSNWMHPVT